MKPWVKYANAGPVRPARRKRKKRGNRRTFYNRGDRRCSISSGYSKLQRAVMKFKGLWYGRRYPRLQAR